MNFLDGHLFPENQQPLIITAAPYAPGWLPSDFPEDIPVTMEAQIQKAVDCYNAGATVLHLHVRELDGKGSKRLSKFNELIAGVRKAVPEMIIQVGGSISFAPETDGAAAKWLSDDTRHMLAELEPTPDQVTVTVNTSQMNVTDHAEDADFAGTSRANPTLFNTYKEMTVPAAPLWVEEHVRRLTAAGIQSAFQCYNTNSFESVERLIRRGFYKGPLVMNWVAFVEFGQALGAFAVGLAHMQVQHRGARLVAIDRLLNLGLHAHGDVFGVILGNPLGPVGRCGDDEFVLVFREKVAVEEMHGDSGLKGCEKGGVAVCVLRAPARSSRWTGVTRAGCGPARPVRAQRHGWVRSRSCRPAPCRRVLGPWPACVRAAWRNAPSPGG